MTEIVCQDTSDAPTESPLYDIQTNPVPTKSIIYGPIVDVERFSGYWLDLLSVIPPAGITFGLLGYLCNMPKIPKKIAEQKPLFSKQSKPPQEPILLHHGSLFGTCMGRRGCWAWHTVTFHACGSVGRTRRSTTSTYAGNFYRSNRPLTSTHTIHGYIVSRYIVRRESSQRHSNVSMTIRHGWWGKRPQRTPHIRVQFLAKNEPKQMPSGTKPRLVTQ